MYFLAMGWGRGVGWLMPRPADMVPKGLRASAGSLGAAVISFKTTLENGFGLVFCGVSGT